MEKSDNDIPTDLAAQFGILRYKKAFSIRDHNEDS
jgi:hypothetical protein